MEISADDEPDAVLAALTQVVDGIAATFGRSCEVVLHDYRRADASVVAVAGRLTAREVGSPMSEIGLSVLAKGDGATAELNYLTRTSDGQVLKSSTLPLKDRSGHLFGALCLNVDVTPLWQARDLLGDLAGDEPAELPTTTFSSDFDDVVDAVLRKQAHELGKPVTALTRPERMTVLRALDQRGAFAVRRAAPRIAEALGISRASLYADLAECRRP
ncbi:helix-turn-helix transcriptional regulator [Kribbella sp. NPDC056861]|uniref:helix-turn-helix transcriptional regulator n=1 Tax=Kribbella sp. NPDC056861 TaxID=3154857 RepID=UPI003447F75F